MTRTAAVLMIPEVEPDAHDAHGAARVPLFGFSVLVKPAHVAHDAPHGLSLASFKPSPTSSRRPRRAAHSSA